MLLTLLLCFRLMPARSALPLLGGVANSSRLKGLACAGLAYCGGWADSYAGVWCGERRVSCRSVSSIHTVYADECDLLIECFEGVRGVALSESHGTERLYAEPGVTVAVADALGWNVADVGVVTSGLSDGELLELIDRGRPLRFSEIRFGEEDGRVRLEEADSASRARASCSFAYVYRVEPRRMKKMPDARPL